MSIETLVRQDEDKEELTLQKASLVGETVFAVLAVEAEFATEQPEKGSEFDKYQFTNSVTRLGDGQTVPDER